MPLWGLSDASTNAVKHAVIAGSDKVGANLYLNVTPSALPHANGQAVGVFAVDATEAAVAGGKITSPGWVIIRQGTGEVVSFTIDAGGSGYANTDEVTVSNGVVNAVAAVTTNATGGIVTLTITDAGRGFLNASAVDVAITAGGTGANVIPVLGGRAGRITYETMVATKYISGDGSDDALLPDS